MMCVLRNTCERRDWCCNFCKLKCDVRCKDSRRGCKWFIDKPVPEMPGTLSLFTYELQPYGGYKKKMRPAAEVVAELTEKRKWKSQTIMP